MASSDYTVRGTGILCPIGKLVSAVNPGATAFVLNGYTGMTIKPGWAGMIDEEIVSVISVDGMTITVVRGCADTIPAPHAANAAIFFFDNYTSSDQREYIGTATIGVKLLMKTASLSFGMPDAPPNKVVFNTRQARPYAPGRVRVNDAVFWTAGLRLDATTPNFNLTWAHRDRLIQNDVLFGHEEDSIGPETGTTYTLRIFNLAKVEKWKQEGIEGESFVLGRAVAAAALGATGDVAGYLTIEAVRDGLSSWQAYVINFVANGAGLFGWGRSWGFKWGG